MAELNESVVEAAALEWFESLGYAIGHGPHLAPGEPAAERDSFGVVVLVGRLRAAIAQLNPAIPEEAREDALRKVLRPETPALAGINRRFHRLLRDGVEVEYRRPDGSIAGDRVHLVNFVHPSANDWLVVNQFTVIEAGRNRRPDIVVFLNGMPLGVIELKNAADEEATIWHAYQQVQTYKAEIPSLLHFNEVLIVSDGLQARIGSLTANEEWFKVWRTINGERDAPKTALELEVMVRGVFDQRRFLDLLQHFIVFEDDTESDRLHKIIAGYHQFHAVNAAVEETVRASGMTNPRAVHEDGGYWAGRMHGGKPGDRRAGVVWHTQGSGKSFSMLFYAARVVRHAAMQNPTLVLLTDRNDLDDQLFGQFQRCHEILGQTPVQAGDREKLRDLLKVASGGVVFTTIQKFLPEKGAKMPELSARQNIVVIADEAHRSQYDLIDGLARHMRDALPNASFIGFTGTPIEKTDANTRAIFGDYISIYDIQRAVADKATVPIYYESRIAKLGLNAAALPKIDADFDEITEAEEETNRERLKTKWAALEALVGDEKRIKLVVADLVQHLERRWEAMDGKAMIVCMSRRICVGVYNELIRLRSAWAGAKDDDPEAEASKPCVVKVVMTGSAEDGPEWQPHIRNKERRRKLATRFKDSKDPFRVVIVRDMWLTGFDAPCLSTMYADKPMRGHGLMQAIARVNRVFRDKPGGLVVDYLGLADQLKHALSIYTESGGKGSPSIDTAQAIAAMLEKHEIACSMMHGMKWEQAVGDAKETFTLLPAAQEHVLAQEDGKKRFVEVVTLLSRWFALCAASTEATEIRDEVAFLQAVKAVLMKSAGRSTKTPDQLDAAVRQLVSAAITTDGKIIDVFTAAGLPKPDISILSDEFLAEVRGLQHKNVAAELLAKLLKDEIKVRSTRNLVQSRQFSELLQRTLNAYHNRAIATQEVIEELIKLAKQLSAADKRGEEHGLSPEEIAFYDALAANNSAVEAMGDAKLRVIAAELVTQVRRSVTIDWTLREGAQAKIRVMVKRILKRFGYPPDLQEEAVKTVLAQAALLCADWADAPPPAVADGHLPVANVETELRPVPQPDGSRAYAVWFGTNRKVEMHPEGPEFTSERGTSVTYGQCVVRIPQAHTYGSTGRRGFRGWFSRLHGAADDRLDVARLHLMQEPDFWETLRHALSELPDAEQSALVYIHGFNVSFMDAALRAAQMGADVNNPGAMAFFSWPSRASTLLYSDDTAAIEASEDHIAEFLTHFATRSGARRVNLIAHSMGNRGLLRAVHRIAARAQQSSGVKFGQVILAAPDVDADVFRNLGAIYPGMSERTTLYVSRKDRALSLSDFIYGYDRAGYVPPVQVLPGIDTIEVSDIDLTLLGHGYFAGAAAVLYDMHELLWSGRGPHQRARLTRELSPAGLVYWRFTAER